jgi:hypothetical protein
MLSIMFCLVNFYATYILKIVLPTLLNTVNVVMSNDIASIVFVVNCGRVGYDMRFGCLNCQLEALSRLTISFTKKRKDDGTPVEVGTGGA